MTDELNQYQKDYLDLSAKYIAAVICTFYEHGGQVAKSKLTISGHKIPCSECSGNARRYIPGELKPICEKCWQKKIDDGLSKIFATIALSMIVDEFCKAMEGDSE